MSRASPAATKAGRAILRPGDDAIVDSKGTLVFGAIFSDTLAQPIERLFG
jgi:hypothetical protein